MLLKPYSWDNSGLVNYVTCQQQQQRYHIFSLLYTTAYFSIAILPLNIYIELISQNLKSGMTMWNPGVLPPAFIAFEGHVHPISSSMLVTDLGYRHQSAEISKEKLEAAAVIHFSGPAKPWLEIGFPEVRSLWSRYVNISNKFIGRCRITGWRNKVFSPPIFIEIEQWYCMGFQREEGSAFSLWLIRSAQFDMSYAMPCPYNIVNRWSCHAIPY